MSPEAQQKIDAAFRKILPLHKSVEASNDELVRAIEKAGRGDDSDHLWLATCASNHAGDLVETANALRELSETIETELKRR